MSAKEDGLEATLEIIRARLEAQKLLLAIAFAALAQQLRDPEDLKNPTGFLDRTEKLLEIKQGSEHLQIYLKGFFDTARSLMPSGIAKQP
ncbi:MAG: hypothetical protein OXC69_02430 [Candidatus Tectomicrobia bacterium]|nr:hypothetical protein [Candidatus Tectomicrobia bacterium]